MKAKIIGVLVLLAALLAGCESPPESGYIIDMRYYPAYSDVTMTCMMYDPKSFVCTMYMPVTNQHPEHWEICLKDDTSDKTGCRDVDQFTYHQYHLGNHYPDAR